MQSFILHKMELNNLRSVDTNVAVRRVPGGWIYEYMDELSTVISTTFVPMNDEFKATPLVFSN